MSDKSEDILLGALVLVTVVAAAVSVGFTVVRELMRQPFINRAKKAAEKAEREAATRYAQTWAAYAPSRAPTGLVERFTRWGGDTRPGQPN